jgi:hypothetical protein
MGLLDKLTTEGSNLTKLNGATPEQTPLVIPLDPKSLVGSQLDLDGKTPTKYTDNLPK